MPAINSLDIQAAQTQTVRRSHRQLGRLRVNRDPPLCQGGEVPSSERSTVLALGFVAQTPPIRDHLGRLTDSRNSQEPIPLRTGLLS